MFKKVQILGPFNSGTNLMKSLLECGFDVNIGRKGQLWIWKHTFQMGPKKLRKMKRVGGSNQVLNIVMVRDPYFWFQSVRRAPYTIRWKDGVGSRGMSVKLDRLIRMSGEMGYCPKVFKHGIEEKKDYDRMKFSFDSLIGLWNHYYRNYVNKMELDRGVNMLFVRYEDLVKDPLKVVCRLESLLRRRSGISDSMLVSSVTDVSKKHDGVTSSNRDEALRKLNSEKMRSGVYGKRALQSIQSQIDRRLMKRFDYQII